VRVIAGTAKGVPLVVPRGATRPTTDLVREAVFSALAGWAGTGGSAAESQLAGLALLDLYAGSGAVACEALSRGAARAVAVDSGQAAVAAMRANAATTGLPLNAVRSTVDAFLARPPDAFDIVWLDPPYEMTTDATQSVLERLVSRGWLAQGGVVALERSARSQPPAWPAGLVPGVVKRYGETAVYLAHSDPKEAT